MRTRDPSQKDGAAFKSTRQHAEINHGFVEKKREFRQMESYGYRASFSKPRLYGTD